MLEGMLIGTVLFHLSSGSWPGFLFIFPDEAGPPPFLTSFGNSCDAAGVGAGALTTGTSVPWQPSAKDPMKTASVEKTIEFLDRIPKTSWLCVGEDCRPHWIPQGGAR
jgi:hypothetical protein